MWIHTVEHFVLHWDTAGQSVGYPGTLLESTSTPRDNCTWYKNISMSISFQLHFMCYYFVAVTRASHANNIPSQFGAQALSVTFQPRNGPGYKNAFTFVNITWVSAVEESWN